MSELQILYAFDKWRPLRSDYIEQNQGLHYSGMRIFITAGIL